MMQQGLDFGKRQTIMEVISLRDRGRFIVVVLSFAISIPSLSLLEPTDRTVWSSNSWSFYDSHWKQNANEDATNIAKVSWFSYNALCPVAHNCVKAQWASSRYEKFRKHSIWNDSFYIYTELSTHLAIYLSY